MRFNPCGYACDWARRPYTTKARFWDHPDAPLVDLVWYFTDLPFLPFPTLFNSKDWQEDPYHHLGIGEVWDAPRNYNGRLHTPGLTGGHICGAREDFEQGPSWPPTGAPLVYDQDGIPTCCRREPVMMATSGARPAAIVSGPPYTSKTTAGARPQSIIQNIPSAVIRLTTSIQPQAYAMYVPPATTHPTAGASPAAIVWTPEPWLTNVTAGPSPSAYVTFAIACPEPVLTCPLAVPGWNNWTCPLFQTDVPEFWRRWDTVPGRTYRCILQFFPSPGVSWTANRGDSCSGLTGLAFGFSNDGDAEFTFTTPNTGFWIEFINFAAYPFVWQVRLEDA